MSVIRIEGAGIQFSKNNRPDLSPIGRSLTSFFRPRRRKSLFWALEDIDFEVKAGEVVGIIGNNGAGKSTLLRIISGVLYPDCGRVQVKGRISSLLSLGAGFMMDLNGRENIYLNGMYLGLRKEEINKIYDQIVAFAELEDFIDTQMRYYSSGMKARLGFAVAVHTNPDILVLDEWLSAGDKNFRQKAENKMKEFIQQAQAIVIASHSTKLISEFCNRCLWLEKGRIKAFGPADMVVKLYLES